MDASLVESRRYARRVVDEVKQVGAQVSLLSKAVANTLEPVARKPRDLSLALIDLADRMERIAAAFDRPVDAKGMVLPFFGNREKAWREDREKMAESFRILSVHSGNLLRAAGLERVLCLGKVFDPHTMSAVAVDYSTSATEHTVAAEVQAGWQESDTGRLLRPAQVRVYRCPNEGGDK